MERWKPIRGFEGRYEVSDLGRVKSLRNRGRGKPLIIKMHVNPSNGYVIAVIGKPKKNLRVNRIVLEAFTRPGEKGEVAAHVNGIRTDNRLANLYWATTKQNHLDKRKHGTNYQGTRHHAAKLNPQKVREIRKLIAHGTKLGVIAKMYGVRYQTLTALKSGKTWFHVAPTDKSTKGEK